MTEPQGKLVGWLRAKLDQLDAPEPPAPEEPGLEELAADCRFTDCGHDTEPGCAVLTAIEAGDLPARRLDDWRKLRREATWIASRTDARLRAELLRERKIIHRAARRDRRGS